MTVCIGALCQNRKAAILVADRMVTSGLAIQFEHPVSNKVTSLSSNCLALTAGNAFAYTELFDQVYSQTGNMISTSVEAFVECIKHSYQQMRHRQIVERFMIPRGFSGFQEFYKAQAMGLSDGVAVTIFGDIERFNYGLEILVGGISPAGAHLYVVNDPGTSQCLDSLGFHAIGSGFNLALSSLIASHCHQEMHFSDALLVALDAKMTAENAPGVGAKTDIALILPIDGGGKAVVFNDGEISHLRKLCKVRRDGDDMTYQKEITDMVTLKLQGKSGIPSVESPAIIHNGDNHAGSTNGKGESKSEDVGAVPATDQVPNESGGG